MIVGEAQVVVRAITSGFQREVQNALRQVNAQQAGSNVGSTFARGFSRGVGGLGSTTKSFRNVSTEATRAADSFKALVIQGYFIGPALSAAGAALSGLVSGLFALGSQLAAALPSLIVFPGVLAAIAQAAVALKFAFSGVGAALKEITKDSKGAGKDGEAARRRIEDAERALARVIERNRETLIRSARDLADAEEALTKARKEAREELEQLAFDAEDAALSEKKAAIELEKARETLARVQDLPPNSRARREAELAFAEADLNLRRARDRNSDLAKEQEEATKKGVEGSDKVLQASRRLADETDANARATRDGIRAQEDAERNLERAKEDAAKAGAGAGTPEFDKLSPAAKEFVEYLKEIKPVFGELKRSIQEEFFPPFTEAVKGLVTAFTPILEDILPRTGRAAGETAKKFEEIVTQQDFLANFKDVGETNIFLIEKLGTVSGNLTAAFVALLDAAGPLIRKFGDWIEKLTGGWKETIEAKNKTGELTDTFNYAGEVAAELGGTFKDLFAGIMNIGKAAAGPGSGGEMLLGMLRDAAARFREFTERISADGTLEQYFRDIVPVVASVGGLFKDIIVEFVKLGDNEGTVGFIEGLRGVVKTLGGIAENLGPAGGAVGEFIDKIVTLLSKFAEAGSINIFFGILNQVLDVLIAIFSNDMVFQIFTVVASITAVFKAFSILGTAVKLGGLIIDGYITKLFQVGSLIPGIGSKISMMGQNFVQAGGGITGLSAAFGVSAGVMLGVLAAIAAVAAILFFAYQKSEKFREAIADLVNALRDALGGALDTILSAIQDVMPNVESFGDIFKLIGDYLAVTLVPIIKTVLVGAIEILGDTIGGLIRVIGGIIKAFEAVWLFIQGFFALLRGDTDKAKERFVEAFRNLVGALKLVFAGIKDILFAPFRAAFNAIARQWNSTIGKLSWSVPRWVPFIGGNSISAPRLPELAMGGTVYPQVGGTLVKVAEAGRPERIEPLDEDGLSKRDRAIISVLSGGKAGGQVFNIYPSQGMDERELAAMISRQLAFQLRAGSV